MTLRICALAIVASLIATTFVTAQPEPSYVADLRFVNELRKQGDTALALEFLQYLQRSKNPSPELVRELPFEFAKTRLLVGTEEPESSKRVALYQQARGDFEAFLAKNPNSPRAAEARLEIAHVAVLQGKAKLSKALTQDTLESRVIEANAARALLVDAGKQLESVRADLEAQLKRVPETDKLQRKKLEADLLQAEFSKALNIFDQGQTFVNTGSTEALRARADVVETASLALKKIADSDKGTIGFQATAWLGRCQQLLGTPKEARKTLDKLIAIPLIPGNAAAISDAHRLGLYFRMLLIKESPEPAEKDTVAILIPAAQKWLKDYDRQKNTPEGYGVRFLLAEHLMAFAESSPKATQLEKNNAMQEARKLLNGLEHSENDYTDRARRMKIALIDRQGGFKAPLEQLKTFDDCYMRSQYEIYMISKDLEGLKDAKEREAKVKARRDAATKALEIGLTKPDAKPNPRGKYSFDVNNARMSLAYTYLSGGKYQEAIKTAEELARSDPRASQAPMAAAYAIQAYAQDLAEREQKVASKEELKPDRDKLLAFAKFAEEKWPNELPANLARHQIGMMLLRDKQLGEALAKLNSVTPEYPDYARVKWQIADACLAAEKAKVEPLKDAGSYSDLALKALLSIPDNTLGSADPSINNIFFSSRIRIGQEYFKLKKFDEMDKLAAPLIPKVATVRLDLDDKRNDRLQHDIIASLTSLTLYAKLGLADNAFKEKNFAKVLKVVGPIVVQVNEDKLSQLKSDPPLANSLLSMALKSAVQLNNLDQTKAVINAMGKVNGDAAGGPGATILLQLVELIQNQMDELAKKEDKTSLDQTRKAFKRILDDIDKGQKTKTLEFTYLLAKNYASLDMHDKAANLLQAASEEPPKKSGMKEADDKNDRMYHTVYIACVHELRLSGDSAESKKMLEKCMIGTAKEAGWGLGHVEAQLERVQLMEEEAKFAAGAKLADQWVNKLKAKAEVDVQAREKYLEFYYHTAYCYYKFGVAAKEKGEKAKGDKAMKDAAIQLVELEKAWKGFGSDASTKRVHQLFTKEPDLKVLFESLKSK